MFVFFLLYDVWLGVADGQLRYQAGGKIDYIKRKMEIHGLGIILYLSNIVFKLWDS